MKVKIALPDTPEWSAAVSLVRKRYSESFDAVVDPNPDRFFVCLSDASDDANPQALACVGITYGVTRRLFSEQYFDEPIERVISEREEIDVKRDLLIEVGSLAATGFGVAAELVRVLPILAWCMGTEYVITTATARVRGLCEKTGIYFSPLCLADSSRLDETAQKNWGRYYEEQPVTGYVRMSELSRTFFSDNTGRYDLGGIVLDVQKTQSRMRRATPGLALRRAPQAEELEVADPQ